MYDLTEQQERILNYITSEFKAKGYPPTVREICAAVGLSSSSTVHGHLTVLEQKGCIRKDPTKPRTIEILNLDREFMTAEQSIINIPVVGEVAAGCPILAVESIESTFPVPKNFIQGSDRNYFILKIRGCSMIKAGILEGDYILVKQQSSAKNKDIVVALLDNEATVKRFFKEKGHIRLQPENPDMEAIILSDVTVLGIVKGVFRKFNQ